MKPMKKNIVIIPADTNPEVSGLVDTDESQPMMGRKTPTTKSVMDKEVIRLMRQYGGNPSAVSDQQDYSEVSR